MVAVEDWPAQLSVDLIVGITEPSGEATLGVHCRGVGLQPENGSIEFTCHLRQPVLHNP